MAKFGRHDVRNKKSGRHKKSSKGEGMKRIKSVEPTKRKRFRDYIMDESDDNTGEN